MSTALFAFVNALGGLLFGINIGFVPSYMEFNGRNADCTINLDAAACQKNLHVSCVWTPIANSSNPPANASDTDFICLFSDKVDCSQYTSEGVCGGVEAGDTCRWDYDAVECKHVSGWQSWQKGLFSGAMIIGGLIGSSAAGAVLARFGRKKVVGGIGLIALLGGCLMFVARSEASYVLMIVARIIIGLGTGGACVACPLYVSEMVPRAMQGSLGVLFQCGVTSGIMLEAFLAFILAPDGRGTQHWENRIQFGLTLPCVLAAGALVALAAVLPESRVWLVMQEKEEKPTENSDLLLNSCDDEQDHSMTLPLLVALVLSFATQMTGISAILNYGPSIAKSSGLAPLTGNLVVMVWNFIATLMSIPIAKRVKSRPMYLTCLIVCTASCFLTGIPSLPGMCDPTTTKILASIGIIFFIMGFQIGMGPIIYVLATELFPPSFKDTGSSFTNATQLVFTLVINFCFPIAVEGLSGGPSGDQNKGMAIVFIIFGGVGLLSWFVLFKYLHPYSNHLDSEQ